MSTILDITVGDTAIAISGTIEQKQLQFCQQSDLISVKFSLIRPDGTKVVDLADGTIGVLDSVVGTVPVAYRLKAADVANPVAESFVRWELLLADGGKLHAPGQPTAQTIVRINA